MNRWRLFLLTLTLITATVWSAVFVSNDNALHLIACDVGQGDAILVTYKNLQVLTDGGPDNKVLDCLAKYMPFWDRTLEVVILTHPQLDHYGGLTAVFARYRVQTFITHDDPVLKTLVGGQSPKVVRPTTGQAIRLGLIHLDILNPPPDFQDKNLNNFSVVSRLTFGNFKALLTGDIENGISDLIAEKIRGQPINYLKVPHHGSKNGLSQALLEAASPQITVISAGRNNRYGHPHPEILAMLGKTNAQLLRTDLTGDIEVVTDGRAFSLK